VHGVLTGPPLPARFRRRAVAAGPRTFLRYPVPSDRAEFVRLHRVSRAFLRPWEGTPPKGPRPGSAAVFEKILKNRKSEASHRFFICRGEDGAILGQIGVSGIIRGSFQSAYVGYWIGKPHAGQGYMSEALGLVLVFAFRTLGLHRVEANIVPGNRASLRLVKRLGFRYEGTAVRYLRINGDWQDHEHWAITVDEPGRR
jgi:ribosomal-protein-alanine N-acetyltransferase